MEHSFDIEVAKEYGILEAVIIRNFQYWIAKNIANRKNFMDGRYWTYNSLNALNELFPYASQRQIRYALDNLVEKGVLIKGCHNEDKRDRTIWFAFADNGKWICQNCQITFDKNDNCICQNCQMIANNIITNNKHTNNKHTDIPPLSPKGEKPKFDFEKIFEGYDAEWIELFKQWLDYKREKKNTYKGEKSMRTMAKKLFELAGGDIVTARAIVEQSMANNWQGLFELKTDGGAGGKTGRYKGDSTIGTNFIYRP